MRDKYERGDWVLYWRRKGGNLRREHGTRCRLARVVLIKDYRICQQIGAC